MRISLINPPSYKGIKYIREGRCMQSADSWATPWPPITLAILGSIAKQFGEVQLLDCIIENMEPGEALNIVDEFKPDLIVLNTGFPSIAGDKLFAEELKKKNSDLIVLSFGVFFTLLKEEALRYCSSIDYAIYGEPEDTFREFLQELSKKNKISPLEGLMIRDEEKILSGPPRKLIDDLDRLPHPSWDLLKTELYVLPHNGKTFTLINSARGCPHSCIFCIAPIYYGKRVRKHSIDYILSEVETCIRDFNIKEFLFWEEAFTLDKKFCMNFCEEIMRRQLNISWAATTRADSIDVEILKKMKASGCMLLGLGIESSNKEILDRAEKKVNINKIKDAVELCKKVGMPTMGHFIFGLPGETVDTAKETIKYALKLDLNYAQAYCAVPYPGTKLGDLAKKNDWIRSSCWSDFDFGGNSIMDIGTISPKEVNKMRSQLFKRFYFRPKYIWKQLGSLRTPRRIINALNFVKWMKGN